MDSRGRHASPGQSVLCFDWRTLKLVQSRTGEIPTVALSRDSSAGSTSWPMRAGAAGLRLADFGGSVRGWSRLPSAKAWSPSSAI